MNSDKFVTATFETTNVTHTVICHIVVQQFAINSVRRTPDQP